MKALFLAAMLASPVARADLYGAEAAAKAKDFNRAFELFRELAELGNAYAQLRGLEDLDGRFVRLLRSAPFGSKWGQLSSYPSLAGLLDDLIGSSITYRIAVGPAS